MNILTKIFGDGNQAFVKSLNKKVLEIASFEPEIQKLKDEDFPKKTKELKERLSQGESLDDILAYAFALVREAGLRTLSERHYDVQMIGGMVLHSHKIAEMRTGEGKTLVATLPAYLNALEGKGVHIVTVNDYLSRRDATLMGQVYAFLGLSVGVINSQNISYLYDSSHSEKDKERDEVGTYKIEYEFLKPCTRKDAYNADITYGTNNEFGFDYLRDNLATRTDGLVARGYHYAIVDEVDSILIDEARTPLIIAGGAGDSEKMYQQFATIASQLKPVEDYAVDEKLKAISLTDQGITKAEKLLGVDNIYTEKGIKYVHHLETAVRARALFIRDKDYVVKDNEVVIVDPFTGRMQPGRRWNQGLHQAVEAKENVKIEQETRAIASITYQNYFRFYKKLSGMTGTGKTSEEEFRKVYNLDVISVPTHRPVARLDKNDQIFRTEKGKLQAITKKVKELYDKGQPVLIGTVSIEKNELLSAYLTASGIPHQVLNAKNHEREGEIIAHAGKKKSVVIATNMAGRGIDIKLGGVDATKEEYEEVKSLGGLFVLGTERHEARRIDNQLRGRSGRQGDPGETQFFVSLEDDLMRIFGDSMKNIMARLNVPEDEAIEHRLISRSLESAQMKIEGFNFDSRKHTLEYDDILNQQRKIVYGRRHTMLLSPEAEIKEYTLSTIAESDEAKAQVVKKEMEVGLEFWSVVRRIILYVTDALWTDHIETMEYTRSSVNLRAYGQREPLVEYRKEGSRLFKEMETAMKFQVLALIETIQTTQAKESSAVDTPMQEKVELIHADTETGGVQLEKSEFEKVGRNDPCPCGSGKKFKKCHG
ncbi:MAG: preprotein translocase subunit SecA [Candidatus Pacebacteria bacterium]|nr:preprotein translocase subunit SecA [Candidatus Paceibacterota bacterium]MBP9780558.1 preprotein translocase subunit SecA [Candidatus Paceibacterota bacterium]